MAASALIVGSDARLAAVIADGLRLAGGESLVDVATAADALAALADPLGIEAVCVAPDVADPLALVQRLHGVARELAAVIVSDPERQTALERERLFTPFLGPDVSCRTLDDAQILGAELSDAAARTRERRGHRATLRAMGNQADVLTSAQPVSGRHFGKLLDRAPIGAVTLDGTGHVRGWNRRADELLGAELPSVGTPFAELFAQADRERLARHLADQLDDRRPTVTEVFERLLPGGATQYLEISAAVSEDETLVALHEVTDRVQAERRQQTLEQELLASRQLLEAVVGGAADAVFVKDLDGRYLLINQAGASAMGHDTSSIVGRTDAELISEEAARNVREDDVRVMRSGHAHSFEDRLDGQRTFLATKAPYFDQKGHVAGVLGTARDITDRKREEDHAHFLNRAAEVLSSLDPEATVRGVAELAVPEIADLCVVTVLGPDGRAEAPLFAHATAEGAAVLEEALRHREARRPVGAAVLETGRSVLEPEITDEAIQAMAADPEHERLLRRLELRSAIVVPLRTGARPMGTIVLARRTSGAAYDRQDLRLAEELAQRAAVAIDNARLHAERTRVAMTLQQSLLPASVARIPGAQLAVRFHAAGQGVDVGGDFYDAFEIEDGVAVVIGDVCGKGPRAAGVTALARYTIRAIAMDESRPDRILRRLNEALLRQRDASDFCTAALMRVASVDGAVELELACGGHPLPLILRSDGTGEPLGTPGTMLGAVQDPSLPLARAELRPGDACILYTDGLNEAAAPRLLSPENLLALVRPAAGRGADAIADRLDVIPATAGERMRDDTAIVVLSVPGAAA